MRLQDDQHFSHQHILIPLQLNQDEKVYCDACQQQILEPFHGCLKCHYWLHDHCLKFPRSLDHPSHPSHPLTLLPKPTYSSRSYSCNACGSAGNSFSMSCAHCEFDLHLHCASLPNSLLLDKHPHELKLLFSIPLIENNGVFVCDVCHSMMNKHHWLYYCAGCDFASHLDCAISKRGSNKEAEGDGETEEVISEGERVRNASEARNQGETRIPEVEQIRDVNEAMNRLYAAQLSAQIAAQGRQACLDLVDPPRRYRYY